MKNKVKTSAEIKAEIENLQLELKKAEELEKAAPPDFITNFNPLKIKQVIDFFEKKENAKFLKSCSDKYGVSEYEFCEQGFVMEFGDYRVQTVDQEGGGEGDGEHWHCVFSVWKNDQKVGDYYIPGWYQSYEGTSREWDSIYPVVPTEKVVIVWKAA